MTTHEVDQRIAAAFERLASNIKENASRRSLLVSFSNLEWIVAELRAAKTEPQPEPCVTPVVGRWCRLRNGTYEWCEAFYHYRNGDTKYELENSFNYATGKHWHGVDQYDVVEVMPEGWEPTT